MPNQHHAEGLERAKRIEHDNQHEGRSGGKGPVKTFASGLHPHSKGLMSNSTDGGGINRKLKPTKQK
jgi:hypothetical protein